MLFLKILDESYRKPSKIWMDKGSEFYNRSMKSWFQDIDLEMYSTHNEFYKYMTSVSKNVYINNLTDIVNKYNDTYHGTIKMKPVDVKSSTYIDFCKKHKDKDPKFTVDDHVRILKHKNIFAKGYVPNWSEEDCVI